MIYILIIYIGTIFLSRYFNKLSYRLDNNFPIFMILWFIPLGNLAWIGVYIIERFKSKSTWFTGKDW